MVLEAEAARAQVERIFQSKTFRSSDVLRHLLSYLVDASLAGTADELKEYTVAVDALGKPSSYDPRQESAVRMQVGRLRQRLAEYYRTEGVDDPIVVDLPKGGFRVVFEPRHRFDRRDSRAGSRRPVRAGGWTGVRSCSPSAWPWRLLRSW